MVSRILFFSDSSATSMVLILSHYGFLFLKSCLNITVSLILFSYLLTVSVTILIILISKCIISNPSFWLIYLIVHLTCPPGCPIGTLKLSSWSLLKPSSTTFLHLLIILQFVQFLSLGNSIIPAFFYAIKSYIKLVSAFCQC